MNRDEGATTSIMCHDSIFMASTTPSTDGRSSRKLGHSTTTLWWRMLTLTLRTVWYVNVYLPGFWKMNHFLFIDEINLLCIMFFKICLLKVKVEVLWNWNDDLAQNSNNGFGIPHNSHILHNIVHNFWCFSFVMFSLGFWFGYLLLHFNYVNS